MRPARSCSKYLRHFSFALLALSAGAAGAQALPSGQAGRILPPLLLDTPHVAGNTAIRQHLQDTIRNNGNVRLIVRLRTPALPEHQLAPAQLQSQRAALLDAQANFGQRLAQYGSSVRKQFGSLPFVVVQANDAGLAHILASSDVVSVQEDRILRINLAQSTPLVGADKAWTAGATGTGQAVAILDTGINSSHSFLSGKVVAEACFSTTNEYGAKSVCPNGQTSQIGTGAGKNCNVTPDNCSHGTHVAGIAAGKSYSFSGVAKDAKLISVQVFTSFADENGNYTGLGAFTSDIISGLEYVYSLRNTHKIAAVNMSLGGGNSTTTCDTDALKPIIDNLRAAGIATVIASGNSGASDAISYPACISTAISVGATTKSDVVDGYSNSAAFLTLLAPGTEIKSSIPGTSLYGLPQYAAYSGTSMAAPHVAGAWAALKSKKPDASVTEVLNALVTTGKPLLDARNQVTKPRLQVDAALAKLSGGGNGGGGGAGACFKASNPAHVAAGRAYASLGYAYAKGSNQRMGLNYSFYTSKLRQTGTDQYVIDNTCP